MTANHQPLLTSEDIQFFSNEDNWKYGPTYDLHLSVAGGSKAQLQDAVSSFPGMLPWNARGEHPRSIVRPKGKSLRPVGLFHLYHERANVASCTLVIYPCMMRYACGVEIWQTPKFEANIVALCHLHESLLELTRWINQRTPVMFASAHDETYSPPTLEGWPGVLWVHGPVAAAIGWQGEHVEDWVGIPI